jgi:hypothetical protein
MNKASPSQFEVTDKAGKAAIGQQRFFARIRHSSQHAG